MNILLPKAEQLEELAADDSNLPQKAIPFIWHFVKRLKWPLLAMSLLYAYGIVAFATEAYLLGVIVDKALDAKAGDMWAALAGVLTAYIVLVQILGRAAYNVGHLIEAYTMPMLKMVTRHTLARHLSRHSYKYFSSDYAGRLAGKVMEMPSAVRAVVNDICFPLQFAILNSVVTLALLLHIHPWLAVPTIIFFIANGIAYRYLIPLISKRAEAAANALQTTRGHYIDSLSNMLVVKIFGMEQAEQKRFTQSQISAGGAEQEESKTFVLVWRFQNICNACFQISSLLLALWLYQKDMLTIGQLAATTGLVMMLAGNVWMLLQTLSNFFSKFAVINEALGTLIEPHEVRDPENTAPLANPKGDIKLSNITFAYPGREVFRDFSLHIPARQKVGLIGPSGAGKSTLIQLLLRLYDVGAGDITIGGQDIREVQQAELRRAYAVIPQSTDLFHRSILENITYGNPAATQEEAEAAAQRAHIHETITVLRDNEGKVGYDALVGEKGVRLSGGQRQRIALARAFLKDAPILILDEPTSALDSESERLIQQSLAKLMEGRTAIVIAHRLSTIAHLDRIVVLEDGRIIEDGSHTELLAKGGLYARLWAMQSEGFLAEA